MTHVYMQFCASCAKATQNKPIPKTDDSQSRSDYMLFHGPGDPQCFTSFNLAQALKQADLMGALNSDDRFSGSELQRSMFTC